MPQPPKATSIRFVYRILVYIYTSSAVVLVIQLVYVWRVWLVFRKHLLLSFFTVYSFLIIIIIFLVYFHPVAAAAVVVLCWALLRWCCCFGRCRYTHPIFISLILSSIYVIRVYFNIVERTLRRTNRSNLVFCLFCCCVLHFC